MQITQKRKQSCTGKRFAYFLAIAGRPRAKVRPAWRRQRNI